jgi:hypothetical protein
MKANEFRIGNWVFDDENIPMQIAKTESENFTKWNFNDFSIILEHKRTYYESKIFPIPLTKEILLKCGFVSCKADKENEWLNLKTRHFNFSSDESVKFQKVFLLLNKTEITCDYLHELQNLYYSLTKTELECKL